MNSLHDAFQHWVYGGAYLPSVWAGGKCVTITVALVDRAR